MNYYSRIGQMGLRLVAMLGGLRISSVSFPGGPAGDLDAAFVGRLQFYLDYHYFTSSFVP